MENLFTYLQQTSFTKGECQLEGKRKSQLYDPQYRMWPKHSNATDSEFLGLCLALLISEVNESMVNVAIVVSHPGGKIALFNY